MVSAALTLGGWIVAGVAGSVALGVRHSLCERREAVARACHELRGPLTAARLGLHPLPGGAMPPPARLRAVDAELGRAALALDDLLAPRRGRLARGDIARVEVPALLADSVEVWQAQRGRRPAPRSICAGSGPGAAVWGRPPAAGAGGRQPARQRDRARGRGGHIHGRVREGRVSDRASATTAPGCRRRSPSSAAVARRRRVGIVGRDAGAGWRSRRRSAAAHGGRLSAAPAREGPGWCWSYRRRQRCRRRRRRWTEAGLAGRPANRTNVRTARGRAGVARKFMGLGGEQSADAGARGGPVGEVSGVRRLCRERGRAGAAPAGLVEGPGTGLGRNRPPDATQVGSMADLQAIVQLG